VASVWSVVVAGGTGTRFGRPKQFALLAGRPVVTWSVEACRAATDAVVLVLPDDDADGAYGADRTVRGGATRAASVRAGLAAVPDEAEVVVVHDAARPLAGPELFDRVLGALDDRVAGALPALAVGDTIKRLRRDAAGYDTVAETLRRDGLVAVQTPQAFSAPVLRAAHATGSDATDDAGLVEAHGATVRIVPGDPRNLKITTPIDLALAALLLEA
jgi:2-C-methyl-D-erythritol 4-phosphate cytidylyltransferase